MWAMNPIPPRCLSGNCKSVSSSSVVIFLLLTFLSPHLVHLHLPPNINSAGQDQDAAHVLELQAVTAPHVSLLLSSFHPLLLSSSPPFILSSPPPLLLSSSPPLLLSSSPPLLLSSSPPSPPLLLYSSTPLLLSSSPPLLLSSSSPLLISSSSPLLISSSPPLLLSSSPPPPTPGDDTPDPSFPPPCKEGSKSGLCSGILSSSFFVYIWTI